MTREQSAVLRGIAILMMIYHHAFSTPEIYELEYFSVLRFGGINVERSVAWFCKITVGLYLFVSGYGMYYVLKRHPVKDPAEESFAGYLLVCYRQVLARLIRLYAQYWYAMAVSMTLVFLFDPDAPTFYLKEFLLNMAGISSSYNGTWWFILQYVKMLLLLPLIAALFQRFSNPAQERKKRIFYAAAVFALLLCPAVGFFFAPGFLELMIKAAHELRISFTLIFIVGYLVARFSVYQRIADMRIFKESVSGTEISEKESSEKKTSGEAMSGQAVSERRMLLAGVAVLAASVVVRVLLSDDPAYAKMDFLIVPVFIFGVLTVLERLPGLSAVLRFFGGLSTYMWLIHIFFLGRTFRPLVMLTGVSTGIFLTLVALSAGAAALLKAGEKLVWRRCIARLFFL